MLVKKKVHKLVLVVLSPFIQKLLKLDVMAQAMLPPWLVGNLSYRDLCVAVSNGLSAIPWAQTERHLLPDSKNCPHCGRGMNLADRLSGTGSEELGGVALDKGV